MHLDLVEGESTESFLLAFDRFMAVRGCPEKVRCDQGRNFVGAARLLWNKLAKSKEEIQKKLAEKGVEFAFNPAGSPHWGGSYERAIRSIRKCLVSSLRGVGRLTDEVLRTGLDRAMAILNERPIAWSQDGVPLTPAHALQPVSSTRFRFPAVSTSFKRYRKVRQSQSAFEKSWKSLYLTQLNPRHGVKRARETVIEVGDVVHVKLGKDWFHHDWVLGKITKIFPSPGDGLVRAVQVETGQGTFYRGVEQVSLLESAIYKD